MKRLPIFAIAAFLLAGLTLPGRALRTEDRPVRWIEAQSPHFLLFTDTSETKARRFLEDFEGRVVAIESAIGMVPDRQFPVEIFLFDKSDDFAEIAGAEAERSAYLFHGPDRVFIAARDKSAEDVANDAGHELGHALFERVTLWRPFWLAEGAAEYFRKAGRKADLKTVSKDAAFGVRELLRIVPHTGYRDSDPPTAFRTQSHRLLRVIANRHPDAIRTLLSVLRTEQGAAAKPDLDLAGLAQEFEAFTETPIPLTPRSAGIRIGTADARRIAMQRGDLLLAAARPDQAGIHYGDAAANAADPEVRAARAILTRFSRNPNEASRALERAARELPDAALVQFHFGSVEVPSPPDLLAAQVQALERAVQALPLLGRAHAELARLYALTGHPEQSLPLVDKALALEPEYGDRFFDIRAQAFAALRRLDDARDTLKIAAALPHSAERNDALYEQKLKVLQERIDTLRRAGEAQQVEVLRKLVDGVAERLDAPRPAPPVAAAPRQTSMEYVIEAENAVTVVTAVYPAFPETLLQKGEGADIEFEIAVRDDGRVSRVTAIHSEAPELNTATATALRRWTFRLEEADGQAAPFTIKLTFRYTLIPENPR